MKTGDLKNILVSNNLKVTPQRLAVLKAVKQLHGHPSPEDLWQFIQRSHPNIALGTVYRALETFEKKGIINKVKTAKDFMRYDSITEKHHHLYCAESEKIEDYFDDELDLLLKEYFERKKLPHFRIRDIKLQITGNFMDQLT
ncbi:MAG TPA: transcriptional repressor [Bacteroidales bacterium]|nr:transcriptional repressor [Bacteroidales bacterium]HRZ20689.1 transcriptional repressor [Bacteroidales bacterium]